MNIQRQVIINERMLIEATPINWACQVSSALRVGGTALLLQCSEPSGARRLTRNVQDVNNSTSEGHVLLLGADVRG